MNNNIVEKIEFITNKYNQQIRDLAPEIEKFLEDLANEYLAKDDIDGIGIQSETDDEGNEYLGVWINCFKADEEYYDKERAAGRRWSSDCPSQKYKEEIEAAIPLVLEKVCIEYGIGVRVGLF